MTHVKFCIGELRRIKTQSDITVYSKYSHVIICGTAITDIESESDFIIRTETLSIVNIWEEIGRVLTLTRL